MSAPENANDRFERLAAEFERETGLTAPGKDMPAAMGGSEDDYRERVNAWRSWMAAHARRWEGPAVENE